MNVTLKENKRAKGYISDFILNLALSMKIIMKINNNFITELKTMISPLSCIKPTIQTYFEKHPLIAFTQVKYGRAFV